VHCVRAATQWLGHVLGHRHLRDRVCAGLSRLWFELFGRRQRAELWSELCAL
jgi:hypothetical protein